MIVQRPYCPEPLQTAPVPAPVHTGELSLACPTAMTREEAQAEAARCFSHTQCTGCEACVLICPDQAISKDPETGQTVIDRDYCKLCGLCVHICPKGAISLAP